MIAPIGQLPSLIVIATVLYILFSSSEFVRDLMLHLYSTQGQVKNSKAKSLTLNYASACSYSRLSSAGVTGQGKEDPTKK